MSARRIKKRSLSKTRAASTKKAASASKAKAAPKAKPKSAAKSEPPQPSKLSLWWQNLDHSHRRRLVLVALQVLLLAVVAGVLTGSLTWINNWLTGPDTQVLSNQGAAYVKLVDVPQWMPDWLSQAIRNELTGNNVVEHYDNNLAARVGQRAEQCLWIQQLNSVRLHFPDLTDQVHTDTTCHVRVSAQYRFPFAIAQDSRSEVYVDFFGFALPHDQAAALTASIHTPRVFGVKSALPAAGQPWRGHDVTAALALIERLRQKPYFNEISAIDMSNFGFRRDRNSSQVLLTAVNGANVTEIRFGALPVDDVPPPGEPTLDQKLSNLDSWFELNSATLTGPSWLDLRYHDKLRYPANYVFARH